MDEEIGRAVERNELVEADRAGDDHVPGDSERPGAFLGFGVARIGRAGQDELEGPRRAGAGGGERDWRN